MRFLKFKRIPIQTDFKGIKISQLAVYLWVLGVGFILYGCNLCDSSKRQSPIATPATPVDTVQYYLETFSQKWGDCDSLNQNCVSVNLSYPHFTSGTTHKVKDSLDMFIKELILAPEFKGPVPKKPEDLLAQMVNEYEALKNDFPGYALPWNLDRTIAICYNTPRVMSIYFEENVFTGGAHPNTTRFYYSFERNSGKPMQLGDLFIANYQEQLNSIAEKKFREKKKIKKDQDLREAGFWFENNTFSINHNFALTPDGILFYFNHYEIAPYSEGPIEIELKAKLISDLVKDKALFQP